MRSKLADSYISEIILFDWRLRRINIHKEKIFFCVNNFDCKFLVNKIISINKRSQLIIWLLLFLKING